MLALGFIAGTQTLAHLSPLVLPLLPPGYTRSPTARGSSCAHTPTPMSYTLAHCRWRLICIPTRSCGQPLAHCRWLLLPPEHTHLLYDRHYTRLAPDFGLDISKERGAPPAEFEADTAAAAAPQASAVQRPFLEDPELKDVFPRLQQAHPHLIECIQVGTKPLTSWDQLPVDAWGALHPSLNEAHVALVYAKKRAGALLTHESRRQQHHLLIPTSLIFVLRAQGKCSLFPAACTTPSRMFTTLCQSTTVSADRMYLLCCGCSTSPWHRLANSQSLLANRIALKHGCAL